MKYIDIYKDIENPLDNVNVISSLLEAFAQNGNFYATISHINPRITKTNHTQQDLDDLSLMIYNRWKKALCSITVDEYNRGVKEGKYDSSIYKLISFLKAAPTVSTHREIKNLLNEKYDDPELMRAIAKYRWDAYGLNSGWYYVNAQGVNAQKTEMPQMTHRLYINVDNAYAHKLAKILVEKCDVLNLPYCFKMIEVGTRDDSFIVYSDTKNLPQYLEVLKEVKQEYPELVEKCGKPPVLTGVIDEWIGYGSEPISAKEPTTFNKLRSESIFSIIEEELRNWYKTNQNTQVHHDGKYDTVYDYLSIKIADAEREELRKFKENNPAFQLDISDDSDYYCRLVQGIQYSAPSIYDAYINDAESAHYIAVPIMAGMTVAIYKEDIIKQMKNLALVIARKNPDFVSRLKERIVEDGKQYGIDPKNYCFDLKVLEELVNNEETALRHTEQTTPYTRMTEDEILESKRKLGTYIPELTTQPETDMAIYATVLDNIEFEKKSEQPKVKQKKTTQVSV